MPCTRSWRSLEAEVEVVVVAVGVLREAPELRSVSPAMFTRRSPCACMLCVAFATQYAAPTTTPKMRTVSHRKNTGKGEGKGGVGGGAKGLGVGMGWVR